MTNKINTIAFDLGGVLAYQDFSLLSEEEKFLFKIYMNRKNIKDIELIDSASKRISEIYLKIHKLTSGAIPALEMLKDMKIGSSIWTNNISEINNWFEEINLYRYINKKDIINSFYVGFDKPNLKFYRRALYFLKSEPKSVLFLDDKSENIISAEKCGINGRLYKEHENLRIVIESELRKRGK